jgi:hypothetical protein
MAPQAVIDAYAALAAVTRAQCDACHPPNACCHPEGCAHAASYMERTEGQAEPPTGHPTLPYMGKEGCVLAPHRRPSCAQYCCTLADVRQRRTVPDLRIRVVAAIAVVNRARAAAGMQPGEGMLP